jgi:Family of unknown function (DUF6232)
MSIQRPPQRIYYPKRGGVAVTTRYLCVNHKTFAIRDLARVGRLRGRRPKSWQLWAYYKGVPTLLWVSKDETEFNQVCRALQRAIEAHREETQY